MTIALIIAGEMILASAVTAVFYWIDKRAAQANRRRVPEKTLLLGSLVGGWPGGLLASKRLRHKTQKVSFRVQFVVASLLNIIAIVGILWFTFFRT